MKALVIVGSGYFLGRACALANQRGLPFHVAEASTRDGFKFDWHQALAAYSSNDVHVFVALDSRAVNSARALLIKELSDAGYRFANLVAPDSYLATTVCLGTNIYVGTGCQLLEGVKVGDGSWLDAGVIVDSDVNIGSCVTLGIGVILEQGAQVGRHSTLSARSHVVAGGKVGEQSEWLLGERLPKILPDRSFHDFTMPEGARILRGGQGRG
ncbi:acetyltransferase [Pseudomonas putida]